ncbi:unnamed protein product [Polarella glacialis]|uniref:Uncharacterized protein n=1 Tax=Polarella glacialis TaxID=89957 RepID=A0A813L9N7_POLGL|nr:unnamed protein product [Polarella glacialis]
MRARSMLMLGTGFVAWSCYCFKFPWMTSWSSMAASRILQGGAKKPFMHDQTPCGSIFSFEEPDCEASPVQISLCCGNAGSDHGSPRSTYSSPANPCNLEAKLEGEDAEMVVQFRSKSIEGAWATSIGTTCVVFDTKCVFDGNDDDSFVLECEGEAQILNGFRSVRGEEDTVDWIRSATGEQVLRHRIHHPLVDPAGKTAWLEIDRPLCVGDPVVIQLDFLSDHARLQVQLLEGL